MKKLLALVLLTVAGNAFASDARSELLQQVRNRKADILAQSFVAVEESAVKQGYRPSIASLFITEQPQGFNQEYVRVTILSRYEKYTEVGTNRERRLTQVDSLNVSIECVSARPQSQEAPTCDRILEVRQRSESQIRGGTGFSSSTGS